jgi:hypothetical protein
MTVLRSRVCHHFVSAAVTSLVALLICEHAAAQQALTRIERGRAKQMLASIRDEIRKNYYDPTFRGRDIDAHFKAADAKLEQATSLGHAMAIIAQSLLDLDDSHTFFLPLPG